MNEIINLGNGALVKVMVLKGRAGDDIQSIVKTDTNVLVDTYTITLTDGSTHTFTVTNGKGISSIAKTATVGLVDTYTITFNDGTTQTFDVTNGNGISTIAKTSTSGYIDTYTITCTNGSTYTFTVTNGVDGTSYSDYDFPTLGTTTFNNDGSIFNDWADGTSTDIVFNNDGTISYIFTEDGTSYERVQTFNADGSITVSTAIQQGGA